MTLLKTSLRAIFAGIAAFGTGLYGAAVENGGSLDNLSDATWIGVSLLALTAAGGVWGFVNPKP